ncbi:MAG TPA: hypothetical protein VGB19_00850 [Actinomycetota bacterium]|nr:hypothetical protein [Actinomycetota bacterium]
MGKVRNALSTLGITLQTPEHWNKWWILMWFVTGPGLIVLAFFIPFWAWVPAALVGFLLPEIISLVKEKDSLPPLTHTIRHYLKDFLAFPIIYFAVGAVGAHWLDFRRWWAVGGLFALLGWLTDHFSVTYAHPDPFPFTGGPRVEPQRRPL